jgi:hypothetical protein
MKRHENYLNDRWRAILIDWLMEVSYEFELTHETVHLAVHYLDQFLSKCSIGSVTKFNLQLVGIVCLWIASKFEEDIDDVQCKDIHTTHENTYTVKEILRMELTVLKTLDWNLYVATPCAWMKL